MAPPTQLGAAAGLVRPLHFTAATTTSIASSTTRRDHHGLHNVPAAASVVRNSSSQRAKKKAQQQRPQKKQPSVLEVQRAIGVVDTVDNPGLSSSGKGSPSMMDILASTPIGQPETSIERKIRETAEWVVKNTESKAFQGQKILLVVCLSILPVWVFLLLVASGALQLPFSLPFLDDLLS